jgi:hypothetical protein
MLSRKKLSLTWFAVAMASCLALPAGRAWASDIVEVLPLTD